MVDARPLALLLLVGQFGFACAADPAANTPDKLFTLSVNVDRAEDGKPLNMTVRETSRTPEFSVVEAQATPGNSRASMLYLARGLCGVMRARGKKLVVGEQISERPVQFRLTFPETASIDDSRGAPRMVVSEPDCVRIEQGPPK